MDIPRTSVGQSALHGFAVQGASRLREHPAPLPSYIASESPKTEAAVIFAPGALSASKRMPFLKPPCSTSSREEHTDRSAFRRSWRPVHRRVRPRLPRAHIRQWRCGSGNRCPERYLRFLWRRQHPGVFGADRGDNDHHQVAHQRLHWLADLCRWQDLPDLEGLGQHDHAGLRAGGRGERRPGGIRQSATPDRLRVSSGPAGRDSVRLGKATTPLLRYASVVIGADSYPIEAVSGQRSGYSLTIKGGLDFPMIAGRRSTTAVPPLTSASSTLTSPMISTTPPAPSTAARAGRSRITTSTMATRLPATASQSTVATRAPSSTTAFPGWVTTASTSSVQIANLTTTRSMSRLQARPWLRLLGRGKVVGHAQCRHRWQRVRQR